MCSPTCNPRRLWAFPRGRVSHSYREGRVGCSDPDRLFLPWLALRLRRHGQAAD